jgi:hypothetical protein
VTRHSSSCSGTRAMPRVVGIVPMKSSVVMVPSPLFFESMF